MHDNSKQIAVIEEYLKGKFPGDEAPRVLRAGEECPEGVRPHEFAGELFRAFEDNHSYDLAFSDEFLQDTSELAEYLENNRIADKMRALDKRRRLWVGIAV